MKLHKNAALTRNQRQLVRQRYQTGHYTYVQLAQQFATSVNTIRKWANRDTPDDKTSAPQQPNQRVTPAYRQAVISYRQANPTHGPVRIQAELQTHHGHFAFSTVRLILQRAALSQPKPAKKKAHTAIPVGRHRTQMDIQQLPAIAGGSGFDYKISIIHLTTRMKYSEIHDNCETATIAEVFKRAWDALPPFLSPSPTTP